jgi:hypothetical protein
MKRAWGDTENREFEQTEIIDIRAADVLSTTWDPFIHSHHYDVRNSFYDSYIAQFPRRSGEALWAQLMECQWLDPKPFPRDLEFPELYEWLMPRIKAEKENSEQSGSR